MDIVPQALVLGNLWIYLSYEDIVKLCQVNLEFNTICQSNSTWRQLLYRDFGVNYTDPDTRSLYLLYRHALEHFSNYFPIITQRALSILVNIAPVLTWNSLEKSINEYIGGFAGSASPLILSIETFAAVCSEIIVHQVEPAIIESIVTEIDCEMIEKMGDSSVIYPNFDEMVEYLQQGNCNQLRTLISKPTLIFVNKEPILINYDYDLASDLISNIGGPSYFQCNDQFKAIEGEILALLS